MKHFILSLPLLLLLSNNFLQAQHEIKTLEIGSQAPDFVLSGTDGKQYSLKDFEHATFLVIVFTCNHCPTAQAYEDRIISMARDYSAKEVAFVAVSPNSPKALSLSELGYSDLGDSKEEMKIRAREKSFPFPYLYDGDTQAVSMTYGPVATPHIFIFDKERKLRYTGRIDDTENPYIPAHQADARNALDALISGKPVPLETTKTFGCSIKWAWKDAWKNELLRKWAELPVVLEPVDEAGIKALLANKSGKLRLINIWATWCGPCTIEFPELVNTDRMYRERDFEFITVSADKQVKKEKVQEFLRKQEASNPNYQFSSDEVYKLIEAVDPEWQGAIPYSLLIEPEGKILWRSEGAVDLLELRKRIIGYLGRFYADNKD
jgi:peroxiredoxin